MVEDQPSQIPPLSDCTVPIAEPDQRTAPLADRVRLLESEVHQVRHEYRQLADYVERIVERVNRLVTSDLGL